MSRFYEDEWPYRRKEEQWHDIPREGRLARVMYPNLAEPSMQRQMAQLAANEQKKSPMQGRIDAQNAQREQSRTKRR
jgi:hypothetical protein